jgi:hypothetical protein
MPRIQMMDVRRDEGKHLVESGMDETPGRKEYG